MEKAKKIFGLLMVVVAVLALWQGSAIAQVKIVAPNIVCGDAAQVQVELPSPDSYGIWTSPMDNIVFETPTYKNTVVMGLQPGKNIICWRNFTSNGEKTEETYALIESVQLNAEVLNKDGETACIDEYELRAAPLPINAVGFWTSDDPNVVFEDATATTTIARNLAEGANTFTWNVNYNEGQCTALKEITIFNNSVTAKISDKTTTITCDGMGTLVAEELTRPNWTGYWTVPTPHNQGSLDSPDYTTCKFSNLGYRSAIFRWTVTNGKCSSSADVYVDNQSVSSYAFAAEDVVCSDECRLIALLPEFGRGFWTSETESVSIDNTTGLNIIVRNLAKGENRFKWTVTSQGGDCVFSQDVVVYNNSVEANVQNLDGEVVNGSECELKGVLENEEKGYWSTCNSKIVIEDISRNKTIAKNLASGDNCFTWNVISADGRCTASRELKIVSDSKGNNVETPTSEVSKALLASNTKIYTVDNIIVVENPGAEINIVDSTGHLAKTVKTNNRRVEIPMPNSGIYIVKTGTKSEKVMVR